MKETESPDIDRKEMTRFQQHWEKLPELTRAAIENVLAKRPTSMLVQTKGASAEIADKGQSLRALKLLGAEKAAKAVALTMETWEQLDEKLQYEFGAVTGKEAGIEVFFEAVAEKMLHGLPLRGLLQLSDEDMPGLLWLNVIDVKTEVEKHRPVSTMDIDEKVHHFLKHSRLFQSVHRIVDRLCYFVRPIYLEIEPSKYLGYFLDKMDFEAITGIERVEKGREAPSREQISKWGYTIFYGFEHVFSRDIERAISAFKADIPQLPTQRAAQVHRELHKLSGDVERYSWDYSQGRSFSTLYYEFAQKQSMGFIDLQVLVLGFEEAFRIALVKTYKEVIESLEGRGDVPTEEALAPAAATVNGQTPTQDELSSLKLVHVFESAAKYKLTMNLLVEKGYCQPSTHIWIDNRTGYKKVVAALIKHLHTLGYYKSHKAPTSKEVQAIAQNTFGVAIGLDTIKRTGPNELPKHTWEFLKPAPADD